MKMDVDNDTNNIFSISIYDNVLVLYYQNGIFYITFVIKIIFMTSLNSVRKD